MVVAFHSLTDYQPLRQRTVPGIFSPNANIDFASCARNRCVYMSDSDNSCIHRFALDESDASRWPVRGKPRGLSVTPSCNLLVTCQSKLVELEADSGRCVREIALPADVIDPWHGVQLTAGLQFVVCHGSGRRDLHRVCSVGDDGKVALSSRSPADSDVGKLSRPRHMAVDKDSQFIFVADYNNSRVVLLSPTLEFVPYVIEDLSEPYRIYLHQSTRRLFVGQWSGDVAVIQL